MEKLKDLQEVTQPDFRSASFVKLDRTKGVAQRMTLADNHRIAALVQLHGGVPEKVRSYMEATKTLFVYGWFYYPFLTLSAFLATTAVEMALRGRFPKQGRDRRGLGALLNQARQAGLLRDGDFPSLGQWREHRAEMAAFINQISEQRVQPPDEHYSDYVCRRLVGVRNEFAHPLDHWIMTPGQAVDTLFLAAETINLLFEK